MTAKRKIGLFGGTFDPVHLGHIHLAALARDALSLDEVRFLPCRISPLKTVCASASGEERCEMLRLATAGQPWAVTDDFELKRAEPSFSYLTAEAMAERFPDARLFWIMGGDQWSALQRWTHPERLAACVEFIVLARGGDHPTPRPGYHLHVVHGQHPASATVIREAIAKGESHIPWLDPTVAAWITHRRIYQQGGTKQP